MRYVGLDIGERRIGVAVSDPSGTVATPLSVIDTLAAARDSRVLRRLVTDYEPEAFVVGLPLTLGGEEGTQVASVRRTVRRLIEPLGVPIVYHDERLTSVEAERSMAAAGADARSRRGSIDMVAAAVLLQSYLDARERPGQEHSE